MVEEVNMAKASDNKDKSLGYSEADLSGHILNANESKNEPLKQSIDDEQKLLHEDYQLYTALTILKGLAIAQK